MVVFLFYFVALLALWFPLPVFFHQSVILYVIYTVWIIAWFHALLCWGFLTDLCLLDTNEWLYCLYSDCLTQLMRCGCLVFTWAQSVLSFFNCCKDPKKGWATQLVYFVAATLSGTCIDFLQEYFVVVAVIAIFLSFKENYLTNGSLLDFVSQFILFILDFFSFLFWCI